MELCNIEKMFNLDSKIYAKIESKNPAGSIKDRVALSIINDAEKKKILKSGSVIIEPTSGNTGIGLAAIAASRGYKMIFVMPSSMSIERIKIMKAYGAEVVLSDAFKGMSGAIEKAEQLNKEIPNSMIAGQFVNPSNPEIHFKSTGPEIYRDLDGKVDVFVASVGTGGTLTGIGEYLKSKNDKIKIIAVEPEDSAVLSGKKANAHKIQGIGAGFVPEILNTKIIDSIATVKSEDAYNIARIVGKTEGILVGISSGANLWATIEEAKKEENKGKNIVTVFPDSGERYLSTDLYEGL